MYSKKKVNRYIDMNYDIEVTNLIKYLVIGKDFFLFKFWG